MGLTNSRVASGRRRTETGLLALVCCLILLVGATDEEKRVSVYSTAANYSLPVMERDNREYVGLLEILEPLGSVSARQEGNRWKLRFNQVEAEFNNGKPRSKIQGKDFDLTSRFLLENGRGLVPLASLTTLLPRFLGVPINFHEGSRRLFVNDVSVHFLAQVNKTAPGRLVMEFSSAVNPTIATEPGKLRMVFSREPVVPPGTNTLSFDDKLITSATYQESNGSAEVTISGNAPLFASFSNDGRTISVSAAPPAAAQNSATPGAPGATSLPGTQTQAPPAAPGNKRVAVLIDASHGGSERGAAISDTLLEKDLTLAFARRLRQELESRGVGASLLRDGDVNLSADQRVAATNAARPALYVCIHAASQGSGIVLYTSLPREGGENRGPFVAWDTAQTPYLGASQKAASEIAGELQKRQLAARVLAAPLRPLNNLSTAALAVEIAAPAGGDLSSPTYQQSIAGALAAGIASASDKSEMPR